jgi:hypothetical protein
MKPKGRRIPIAEAAAHHAGTTYAARMYPQWVGTYGTASPLTEYFRRVNRAGGGGEWVPIAWDVVPKSAYRRLRAELAASRQRRRGRVRS